MEESISKLAALRAGVNNVHVHTLIDKRFHEVKLVDQGAPGGREPNAQAPTWQRLATVAGPPVISEKARAV